MDDPSRPTIEDFSEVDEEILLNGQNGTGLSVQSSSPPLRVSNTRGAAGISRNRDLPSRVYTTRSSSKRTKKSLKETKSMPTKNAKVLPPPRSSSRRGAPKRATSLSPSPPVGTKGKNQKSFGKPKTNPAPEPTPKLSDQNSHTANPAISALSPELSDFLDAQRKEFKYSVRVHRLK